MFFPPWGIGLCPIFVMLKALLWYSGCQSGSFLESRYPPGRFIRYGIKYWISQKALDRMTYLARQGGTYVSDYALQSDAVLVAMVNPDRGSKNLRSIFRWWKGLVVLKSECGKMNRSQVWWIRPVPLLCHVALQPLSSPVYGSAVWLSARSRQRLETKEGRPSYQIEKRALEQSQHHLGQVQKTSCGRNNLHGQSLNWWNFGKTLTKK